MGDSWEYLREGVSLSLCLWTLSVRDAGGGKPRQTRRGKRRGDEVFKEVPRTEKHVATRPDFLRVLFLAFVFFLGGASLVTGLLVLKSDVLFFSFFFRFPRVS